MIEMLCSIDGCQKPSIARGWCWAHWARWRRHGNPLITLTIERGKEGAIEKKRASRRRYRLKHREELRLKARAEKVRAQAKLYRETHKEQIAAQQKTWRRANPGRLKNNVGKRRQRFARGFQPVTAEMWNVLLKTYAGRCAYCGCHFPLTQDHVLPLVKGGQHSLQNLVPSCQPCNSLKGVGPPLAPVKVLLF